MKRSGEERVVDDAKIARGVHAGLLNGKSQRARRAVRSMERSAAAASTYSDPWIEAAEEAAVRPPPEIPYMPPYRPVQAPKKPLLSEKQQNVIFETLFGQAAPMAQSALEMAQSETGQKVVAMSGVMLGAMLLPKIGLFR